GNESEPPSIAKHVGDIRCEQRLFIRRGTEKNARGRPARRRQHGKDQRRRARASLPAERHANGEPTVEREGEPVAPGGGGSERSRGHGHARCDGRFLVAERTGGRFTNEPKSSLQRNCGPQNADSSKRQGQRPSIPDRSSTLVIARPRRAERREPFRAG